MKKILGLDIGTNSIGWALIQKDDEKREGSILGMGSRIVPMDDNREFEQGQPVTRNATRRMAKGARRGNHRYKNRRNKLTYVLAKLGLLPTNITYGFESKNEDGTKEKIYSQFPLPEKLQSLFVEQKKGEIKNLLTAKQNFELRVKAISKPINDLELGKILYQYNQKRGYSGGGNDDEKSAKTKEKGEYKIEYRTLVIKDIKSIYRTEKKEINKKGTQKEGIPIYKIEYQNIETKKHFYGESYNDFIIDDELEVIINKKDNADGYNFLLSNNELQRFEGTSTTHERTKVKIIDCKKAQELKRIGKKFYPLYNITFIEDELPEKEKLGERQIALADIDKKEFETGKEVEVECRITIDEDGEIKKVEYAKPNKTNWRKQMDSIEKEIAKNKKEKGEYFLSNYFIEKFDKDERKQWFRVKENVILRKRYKEEFDAIWNNQIRLNESFKSKVNNVELLKEIVKYIFPGEGKGQEELRKIALDKGLKYLVKEMIIFYQRPLKDQSKNIGNCQYEKDQKVIPVSHPLYQEYRIWDQINRIYVDVKQPEGSKRKYKKTFITKEQKLKLHKLLHSQKEITFNNLEEILQDILPNFRKNTDKKIADDKKNKQKFFYDAFIQGLHRARTIKGNDTLYDIKKLLGIELFVEIFGKNFMPLQSKKFFKLWKLLFDQYGNGSDLDDPRAKRIKVFIDHELKKIDVEKTEEELNFLIKKLTSYKFARKYGSLSKKAIKNILPLMQVGSELPELQKQKIGNLAKVYNENLNILKKFTSEDEASTGFSKAMLQDHYKEYLDLKEPIDKGGWMNWAACQLIYGRHTAKQEGETYEKPSQIKALTKEETLRNPVVEQIVNETLQIVKDIWKYPEFAINNKELEIRVELARELKNSAGERKSMFDSIIKNEKNNKEAINEIMQILTYDDKGKPKKLENNCNYENCGCSPKECPLQRLPTKNELTKYKLWKEQSLICPYTGSIIPLCNLFSEDGSATYNKEHIIPKQRFFDNSNGNLVIADRQANALKDNLTAVEFIKRWGGESLSNGKKILKWDKYETHVKDNFKGRKLKNLLLEKIPDDFIERQIKDTQYIARKVKEKLMQIVGEKNVVTTTGGITDYLRESWGLNQEFKELTQGRYKLMALVANDEPGNWVQLENRTIDGVLKKVSVIKPGVWSKRLDHRHHALDALVVAATDQGKITSLNTLHQTVQDYILSKKDDLLNELGEDENQNLNEEEIMEKFAGLSKEKRDKIMTELGSTNKFDAPWIEFAGNAKNKMQNIIVSHKRKQKILIQKVKNEKTGKEEWRLKIRGALHQETVYGKIPSNDKPKMVNIKTAFSLSDYITNIHIKNQVFERLEAFGGDIDEAIASLKEEKIKNEKNKAIKQTEIFFTEKDVYRLPVEKFGEKKDVVSFIDKIVSEKSKSELNDHLHRYCFSQKLEDKESNLDANLSDSIKSLLENKLITEELLESFYADLKNAENVKKWVSGKLAFAGDGLKYLNSNRQHPINAVKVLYSKTAKTDALKPINRGYVKAGDNYCFVILQKDRQRHYTTISFFDAAKWVTEQFNIDNKRNYHFPNSYDKKTEYVNNVILNRFKQENPAYNSYEVLFILQQDDLVEFTHSITSSKTVYRVVKYSGETCHFTPHNFARHIIYKKPIKKKRTIEGKEIEVEDTILVEEYSSNKNCAPFVFDEPYINNLISLQNIKAKKKEGPIEKEEKTNFEPIKIQEHCVKLNVDRLGNVKPA